jgi:hypothetical protein
MFLRGQFYIKLREDPAVLVTVFPLSGNNHSSVDQRMWEFILDIGGNICVFQVFL